MFPRIVKESNNQIRLTGSWLTEIGELDTAGKYFFFSHTTSFRTLVYLGSHCFFLCVCRMEVVLCAAGRKGKEMALAKGNGSQE